MDRKRLCCSLKETKSMMIKFNKFLALLIFFLACTLFRLSSEGSLAVKSEYSPVVGEIIEILAQNHFKKNIEINDQKVIKNFLVNLDKEKIVFTTGEINSYSAKFKSIYNLDEIFKIYENYSNRSLELINYQIDVVNLINDFE